MAAKPQTRVTELRSNRYLSIHSWGSEDILVSLLENQFSAVASVQLALGAISVAVEDALPRILDGGRLVYIGAGTSGRIGVQDGAELSPTFNWPPNRLVLLIAGGDAALTKAIENAEDDEAAAIEQIRYHEIGKNDVVIGIAASGTTPFTVAGIVESNLRGALTIGVANNPETPLLKAARNKIYLETGSEVIAGSTRLKAGTAQKITLNLFSTLLMIRLNRVWKGQMVDMRVTNEKLRNRAVSMLKFLTGMDEDAVKRALEGAGGNVKTAIVMLNGLSHEDAVLSLHRNNSNLDDTLAGLSG